MNGRRLKRTQEEVVPKALDLHILMTQKAQVDEHICADSKLNGMTRVPPVGKVERRACGQRRANVGEIAQIEQVTRGTPQNNRDHLEDDPKQRGNLVLCHGAQRGSFPLGLPSCHYARNSTKLHQPKMYITLQTCRFLTSLVTDVHLLVQGGQVNLHHLGAK